MAGNIKGITIEFQGDTTKLQKSIRDVSSNTRKIDLELKRVNNALKFNPTNIELWRQKQTLLTQKIGETEKKLSLLKQQQKNMDATGVDKNSKEYRELQKQIIVTESQLKTFKGQLKSIGNVNLKAAYAQFKQWGNQLTNAGQKMKGLSTAAAGVVGALGAVSYKAGKNADDINTMSKVYGISTKNLQKYQAAADLVDVSVESIAKSQTQLKKKMYAAQQGSGTMKDAFKELGVSVTDTNGNLRNGEEVWDDVISALGNVKNESKRSALGMKLMGRSAQELNPLIEDGGKTYKSVADTLKKYNLDFVDQKTLDKANQFNDQLDTMKMIGSVAISQVGAKLADALSPALEKVVGWIGKLAGWLSSLSPKTLAVIGTVAAVVAALAPALLILGKLAFSVSSIITLVNTVGAGIGALAGPIGIAVIVIGALIAAGVTLYKNWDSIKASAIALWNGIKSVFGKLKSTVSNAWNGIKSATSKVWDGVKTTVTNAATNLAKNAVTRFNTLKTNAGTIFRAMRTVASTMWSGIKSTVVNAATTLKSGVVNRLSSLRSSISNIFSAIKSRASSVWSGIKNAITKPIQSAVSIVSGAISKIKSIINGAHLSLPKFKLPHFRINGGKLPWGIGGKGVAPSINVDWYAKGGIFDSPSLIGVGEAGSEAVVPLDKFWNKLDKIANAQSGAPIVVNVYGSDGMSVDDLAAAVERKLIETEKRRALAWR